MTVTESPPVAPAAGAASATTTSGAAGTPPNDPSGQADTSGASTRGMSVGAAVGLSVLLAVALVLGFLAYLVAFSSLSEQRAQHALRQQFSHELSQAVAPVGPVAAGTPVTALSIPALGIRNAIVVEGTTSRNMMAGPGHLSSSPLPGQPGTSVIYGKVTTFGAPFRSLLELRSGDKIVAVTGEGRFTYQVSSFGDTSHPAPANSDNRLVLVTTRPGIAGGNVVSVSADLKSAPGGADGVRAAATGYEKPLGRDTAGTLLPLFLWSLLLLGVAALSTVVFVNGPRVTRWPVVLCALPVALAVIWNVYESAAGLIPNLL